MAILDRWGIWFKNIKLAANLYVALAVLAGIFFYFVDSMSAFFGWFWAAVLKGVLIVLAGYYTLAAALLTKLIYEQMLKKKKARV